MKIVSRCVNDTLNIGKRIAANIQEGDIICLYGDLGSGKTVLTKGIAQGLGIKKDKVISPSFVLIRQYNQGVLPLYHFDLYRLRVQKDILALGYEEYLYNEGVAVIEWADRLGYLLPKEYLRVDLGVRGAKKRQIEITFLGRRYEKLVERLKR